MKKIMSILLVSAFTIGLMSFTSKLVTKKQDLQINNDKTVSLKSGDCDYYERTCYYQNGVNIGCTAWTCVVVLDEVVLKA